MTPPHAAGRPAALMVIDDEAVFRRNVRIWFQRRGHDVRCADSAEAGLAALAERGADGVILDCHLPGIDGVEAALRIRALDPRTMVIRLSGNTPPCAHVMARGARPFRCPTKPLPLREPGKLVADALRGV